MLGARHSSGAIISIASPARLGRYRRHTATEGFSGSASGGELMQRPQQNEGSGGSTYRGARGLPKELIQRIERMYGFDKPVWERFIMMMKSYVVFDFGDSFFRNRRVVDLVIDKMPVSIS